MAVKKIQSKDGIASWKIDSPVERWLAKRADKSDFWKRKAYDLFGKYYKRELILLTGRDDKDLFASFVSRHESFIVKPYNGSGGRGISIYYSKD